MIHTTNTYTFESYYHSQLKNIDFVKLKDKFHQEGLCIIKNFINQSMLHKLKESLNNLSSQAFYNKVKGNAYLNNEDPELPKDHAKNIISTTSLSVIAYDQIPEKNILKQIYHNPNVLNLISTIIDKGPLYPYACPLGAINIAYMKEGDSLRWHFDQSDFVVSLPIQDADAGGQFEYVANIRSAQEENYNEVRKILLDDYANISSLTTAPGSLIIFQGKNTIHRVREVLGKTPRVVALFAYSFEKDFNSSDYLRKIRYGRTQSIKSQGK